MFGLPVFLPLVDFKTLVVPPASGSFMVWDTGALAVFLALVLAALVLGFLRSSRNRRSSRRPDRKPRRGNWIVVDGSNVMHWQDNTPRLAPVLKVISDLRARGFDPGVVFDANAGHKLFGRYVNEPEFGRMLDLPADQVLVVPKGTPADPYILATARQFNARIVTNDRFRDWADQHPEVTKPGLLIRGEMDGDAVRLKGVDRTKASVS